METRYRAVLMRHEEEAPQELGIGQDIANSMEFFHLGSFQYKCRWNEEWLENEVDHVLITRVDSLEIFPNENEISRPQVDRA